VLPSLWVRSRLSLFNKHTHKCVDSRERFLIEVETIFEDSKIELRVWLVAIWLITYQKRG
jgi:hypothetical protein